MIANPNDGNTPQVEQATPQISVSAAGLITAKTEQEKGYVPGGTKSATKQLTTQAAKTVTPTTTNQTAVASGRYTTGNVVVAGDANLKAENIAEGVTIFGVTGTHSGGAGLSCYSVAFSGAGDERVAAYLLADGTLQTFYGANTEYQSPAVPRDDVHAAFFIPNVTNSLTTIDGVEVLSHPDIIKAGSYNGAIAPPVYLMILTKDITVSTKLG